MKLSILIPSYKQKNELKSLLDSCYVQQKNEDFEVIVTINKPTNDELNLVYEYKELFKDKLKILINTKRQGVIRDIFDMLTKAVGEYFIVVFPETNLKNFFVKRFIEIEKKYKVDIIEFKPKFKGFFQLEPKKRIQDNKIFKIQEDKKVIAYTFPIIFNKFFNTNKFLEITANTNFKDASSKYLIEILYKTLPFLESYVYIDEIIVNEWNNEISIFNPSQVIRDWKNIENFTRENKIEFMEEILYAKLYFLQIFIPVILGVTKKSLLTRLLTRQEEFPITVLKYYEKLKLLRKNEFNLLLSVNKYILLNSNESKLITENTAPSKWHSISKKI
ncbi:glycosyltransferase family 2 protein [Mycoplasma sp. 5370]